MSPLAVSFASLGYAIIPDVFPPDVVLQICSLVERGRTSAQGDEAVANNSGVYALRNLTDVIPELATILLQPALTRIVEDVLGQNAFVTRATLFDKTVGANWGVFWHQDLSIAVQEKHDVPGFGAWTRKAGVISVQPPLELMSRILAVRIHLDSGTRSETPGRHARLTGSLGVERSWVGLSRKGRRSAQASGRHRERT